MANTLTWTNLNTIFTVSGPAYLRGKLEDTFFDMHPFFMKVRSNANGIVDSKIPGVKLVLKLRIGYNTTIGNRGTREKVPIAEQETVTTAQFPWGSLTGSTSIYEEDLHDNMDDAQIIDILEPLMDQAVDTWTDRLSLNVLHETSADSNFQFLGLKDAVTDGTWTHPPDYGGITPTTVPNWKSYVKNNGGTLVNLVDDLNNVFNTCTFGTDVRQPDMILTDQKGEELYRSLMDPNIRYTDTVIGDGTINAVTFRGMPVVFDRQATPITTTPTGWTSTTGPDTASTHRFYVLNTRTWQMNFDPKWNLDNAIDKDWKYPVDEFSRLKLIALRGQMICKNRRYNGVLVNVPES